MSIRGYFDYNGSTPVDPDVAQVYFDCLQRTYGNTAAAHPEGSRAREALEEARSVIAEAIGAEAGEIWFGSGGTEVNNWALIGAAQASEKKHVVISAIEHKSVLLPARYLSQRGWSVSFVACEADGAVSLERIRRSLRPETLLVSLMHANNETGVIQPVASVCPLPRAGDTSSLRCGRLSRQDSGRRASAWLRSPFLVQS